MTRKTRLKSISQKVWITGISLGQLKTKNLNKIKAVSVSELRRVVYLWHNMYNCNRSCICNEKATWLDR